MLKLKLQYSGYLMPRTDSLEKIRCWKRLKAGDVGSIDSITKSLDMNLSKLQEIVEDRGAWHAADHGVTKRLDTT